MLAGQTVDVGISFEGSPAQSCLHAITRAFGTVLAADTGGVAPEFWRHEPRTSSCDLPALQETAPRGATAPAAASAARPWPEAAYSVGGRQAHAAGGHEPRIGLAQRRARHATWDRA
jgi:hypothetical protein